MSADTPYQSPRHAIARAMAADNQIVLKASALFREPGGAGDLTTHDLLAQASMVRTVLHAHLRTADIEFLRAHYLPADGLSLQAKRCAEAVTTLHIHREPRYANLPLSFVDDTVREWCGDVPRMRQRGWLDRMGVSSTTLWRLRNGNKAGSGGGIYGYLDSWEQRILSVVSPHFHEQGLTAA